MPRRRTALLSSLLLVACATATAAACSSGGDEAQASNEDQGKVVVTGGAAGSSAGGSAGASGTAAGGKSGTSAGGAAGKAGGGVVGNPDVTGVVIEPATATIDVVDGVAKPVKFTAKPKYANGTVGNAIGPTWQVDLGDVANVDKDGNVTAAGARGGLVTLGASWQSYKATATVTVKLHLTVNPGKLSDADKTKLAGATDADTIPWMYPYDATVFPRGLSAPRLMWGAAPAAPMMFTAKGEFAEITSYFNEPAPGHQPDATLWTKLTESGTGGPVQVQVARLDATGKAKVVMKQTWRIAAGNLKGTVYYWANSLGRVVRIKPGAAAPDDFLKAAGQNDGCTTCHAVSANGNVLTLGGGKAQAPEDSAWSIYDLVGNKLVAKDRGRPWAMLALTPDGKFAALNNAPLPGGPGLDGGFYDVATGAKVPGSGFDTELFDMPSFSPDGTRLVYVDHATKGLVSLGFSQATGKPVASGKVPLVPASGDPKLNLIAFPVVSPDGKWAVYHRGPLDTRDGPADSSRPAPSPRAPSCRSMRRTARRIPSPRATAIATSTTSPRSCPSPRAATTG